MTADKSRSAAIALIHEAAAELMDADPADYRYPAHFVKALDEISKMARAECAEAARNAAKDRCIGGTGVAKALGVSRQAVTKRFRR